MVLLQTLIQNKISHKVLEELIFASMEVSCHKVIDLYLAPANHMTIETILSTLRFDSTYLHISHITNPGMNKTPYYEFYINTGHYVIICNVTGHRAEEFLRKHNIVLTT